MAAVDVLTPPPLRVNEEPNEIFNFDDAYDKDESIAMIDFVKVYDRTTNGTNGSVMSDVPPAGVPNATLKNHWRFLHEDVYNWYLPSRSFLKFQFRLNRATPAGIDTSIETISNDIRSLLERVILKLGGITIHDFTQLYWVWGNTDHAFWTKQYLDTVGSQLCCYPVMNSQVGIAQDTGVQGQLVIDETGTGLPPQNATRFNNPYNGYGKRVTMTNSQEVLTAFVPLYHIFPVFQYYDKVMRGLSMEIELYNTSPTIALSASTGPTVADGGGQGPGNYIPPFDSRLTWHENGIELWMRRITPTQPQKLLLDRQLQAGIDIDVKFEDFQLFYRDLDANDTTFDERFVTTASRPTRAVVAFQLFRNYGIWNNANIPGVVNGDNVKWYPAEEYHHGNIKDIRLMVNGISVPKDGIQHRIYESMDYGDGALGLIPDGNNVVQGAFPYRVANPNAVLNYDKPYYEYLKMCGNYRAPYLTNFQDSAGVYDKISWKNCMPLYCFDLAQREIDEWAGGASDIHIRFDRYATDAGIDIYPNGPVIGNPSSRNFRMYVIIYTEREAQFHYGPNNSFANVK